MYYELRDIYLFFPVSFFRSFLRIYIFADFVTSNCAVESEY
jgi:hypothetical protein